MYIELQRKDLLPVLSSGQVLFHVPAYELFSLLTPMQLLSLVATVRIEQTALSPGPGPPLLLDWGPDP